jgi:hypothetical protein
MTAMTAERAAGSEGGNGGTGHTKRWPVLLAITKTSNQQKAIGIGRNK